MGGLKYIEGENNTLLVVINYYYYYSYVLILLALIKIFEYFFIIIRKRNKLNINILIHNLNHFLSILNKYLKNILFNFNS